VPNETVNFEVYALKYATRDAQGSEHFYGHDIHDYPMPMDYFVWAAVSDEYLGEAGSGAPSRDPSAQPPATHQGASKSSMISSRRDGTNSSHSQRCP
jgi:hypothetical protein